MATRTRTQAPAKKTPAKKPTPAATSRKRATKKPAPPHAPAPDRRTTVDLRHPLPTRRSPVGPLSAEEQTAARAALASAMLALPIPVLAWHGPTAHLQDGTRLTHTDPRPPILNTPTNPPQFTAHVPCPHGATHQHPVHSAADLAEARAITRTCTGHTQPDGTPGWDNAITQGVPLAPEPRPAPVFHLTEGVRRHDASTADTQPMSLHGIAGGLQQRAGDEQPKEHPQP